MKFQVSQPKIYLPNATPKILTISILITLVLHKYKSIEFKGEYFLINLLVPKNGIESIFIKS